MDITEYLCLPQSDAAVKLGLPVSTLSKRWKEAAKNRKVRRERREREEFRNSDTRLTVAVSQSVQAGQGDCGSLAGERKEGTREEKR